MKPYDYDPNNEINKLSNDLNLSPSSYPNYGLYHDYDDLINSYPQIIYWDIEKQIKYSDAITRRYCLNKKFLFIQRDLLTNDYKTKSNCTSIGNIAIICFYNGFDSEWGKLYIKSINSLKELHF